MGASRLAAAFLCLLLSAGMTLTACGTMKNGRRWGQDATIWPGFKRLGESASKAALSPGTWAPLAGALALQIGDADGRISEWASENTPIFGSQNAAEDASDYFRGATRVAYFTTVALTPDGSDPACWTIDKLKGLAVGLAAISVTGYATDLLKDATGRMRPNDSDDKSFPSAHASKASVQAVLAARNIDAMNIDKSARTGLKAACYSFAAITGWARVEADMHYPSDVLAGLALGYFLGAFFYDAFLGIRGPEMPLITLEPIDKRGLNARLKYVF